MVDENTAADTPGGGRGGTVPSKQCKCITQLADLHEGTDQTRENIFMQNSFGTCEIYSCKTNKLP